MVDGEDQHMVVWSTPHEGESEERAGEEIKWLERFLDQESINFGFKLSRGEGGTIPLLEWRSESRLDDLNRLSINFLKVCAKRVMACENEIEAGFQNLGI
jgi:hypothetical protein